jgi:hypothetical protein
MLGTLLALLFLLLLLLGARLLLLPLLLALLIATLLPSTAFVPLLTVVLAASGLARALLELAQLLVHEATCLVLLLCTRLIVTAVGAAFPAFGKGLPAGVAENTFGQRHQRIGAHCTLRPVDENRRQTLLALVHLAGGDSPSACWDDARAVQLLRTQTTPEELRELGADQGLIEHVFPETHVG